MAKARHLLVSILLFLETLITAPIFALSWICSAIALAVVGGHRFAQLQSDTDKRAVLNAVLGGKAD